MNAASLSIRSERTIPLIAYILHLIGSVTGVLSIGALILNYVRRNDYADGLASHHRFMIRTFWWTVLWLVIGWIMHLTVILAFIGWVLCAAAWFWYVYRHIRGLVALANGEQMAA